MCEIVHGDKGCRNTYTNNECLNVRFIDSLNTKDKFGKIPLKKY